MINDETADEVETMTGVIVGVFGAIAIVAICAIVAWAFV